jgi:hypothetical protein
MDGAEIYRQRAENAERVVRTDRCSSHWANSVGRPRINRFRDRPELRMPMRRLWVTHKANGAYATLSHAASGY